MDEKLIQKIGELKRKRNAIILAHNYQSGAVQDIADYVGDSLELSIKAARTKADVILFCGVRFMAETASILSPEKIVLMPDKNSGCPLADMVDKKSLKNWQKKYPDSTTVAYVNTTAAVKAESDICCTSANADKVVSSLDSHQILFIPDKHLAHWTAGRVPDKKIIPYPGYCPVHMKILAEDILRMKKKYPAAEVIVHAECSPSVIALSDRVLSTGGMCNYAMASKTKEFIVGTEIGIIHRLKKENPEKKFYPANEFAVCSDMKLITPEKIAVSLSEMKYKVKIPGKIRENARKPIERMLNDPRSRKEIN